MSSRPWMPLYIGDYHRDTMGLTTLEHGAYLLLIMHYWSCGGLPNDERQLHRITRCPNNQWAKVWKTLQPYFSVQRNNSGSLELKHNRIEEELKKAEMISLKRSVYGEKGARASRGKTNLERNYDRHLPGQRGDHSQSPIKISSYLRDHERAKKQTTEEER